MKNNKDFPDNETILETNNMYLGTNKTNLEDKANSRKSSHKSI